MIHTNNPPDIIGELRKCAISFDYFCKTYLKVNHPVKGLIPFELNDQQKQVIDHYDKHQFPLIRKYRQGGFTTLSIAYSLYLCLFSLDQRVLIIARTDMECRYIFNTINTFLSHMPSWMKGNMTFEFQGNTINFIDNNSRITCDSKINQISDISLLILDEAAFITNAEEIFNCYLPSLSANGKCILTSTFIGYYGWFYNIYNKSLKGENKFTILNVDYRKDPNFQDEDGIDKMKKLLGKAGFDLEFETLPITIDEVISKDNKEEPEAIDDTYCLPGKTSDVVNSKYDEKVFHCYDVETKPIILTCEKKNYTSEEMPFLKRDESEINISEDVEILSGTEEKPKVDEDEGYEFDDLWFTGESISEVWKDISKVMPEYKDEANRLCNKYKKRNYSSFRKVEITKDLLELAGITENDQQSEEDNKDKLLSLVLKEMPEGMELEFDDDFLCINNIPTNITTRSIEMAFDGLLELCNEKVALTTTTKILRDKLALLF